MQSAIGRNAVLLRRDHTKTLSHEKKSPGGRGQSFFCCFSLAEISDLIGVVAPRCGYLAGEECFQPVAELITQYSDIRGKQVEMPFAAFFGLGRVDQHLGAVRIQSSPAGLGSVSVRDSRPEVSSG